MKQMNKMILLLSVASTMLSATVYQDHNDMNASKWGIYDNTPRGASIAVVTDDILGMDVIEIKGSGTKNGFIMGQRKGENSWKNNMGTQIMWGARFNEKFTVYIYVETETGPRYLYYTPINRNLGIRSNAKFVHHGLGSSAKDGQWKGFERDLDADLKEFEPDNAIVSVNAFLVRGSGYISEIVIQDENYAKMLDVSSDGSKIFSSNGETINVLRPENTKERPLATFSTNGKIKDIALSGAGDILAVLHEDSLETFDVSTSYDPQLLNTYPVDKGLSVDVDESGSQAFIGKKDEVITIDIGL